MNPLFLAMIAMLMGFALGVAVAKQATRMRTLQLRGAARILLDRTDRYARETAEPIFAEERNLLRRVLEDRA
jgi:hypothetical protein